MQELSFEDVSLEKLQEILGHIVMYRLFARVYTAFSSDLAILFSCHSSTLYKLH